MKNPAGFESICCMLETLLAFRVRIPRPVQRVNFQKQTEEVKRSSMSLKVSAQAENVKGRYQGFPHLVTSTYSRTWLSFMRSNLPKHFSHWQLHVNTTFIGKKKSQYQHQRANNRTQKTVTTSAGCSLYSMCHHLNEASEKPNFKS